MSRPRRETVTEEHIREAIKKLSVEPTDKELADLDKLVELSMKEAGVSEEYASGVDLGKKRNKAWEVLQSMKEAGDTTLVIEGEPEDYLSTRDVSQAATRETSRSHTREASPERAAGANDKSDPANVPKEAVESEEKAVEEAVDDLEAMKHKPSAEGETVAETDKSGAETKAADESKEVPEAADDPKEVSDALQEPKEATEATEATGATQPADFAKETSKETSKDSETSVDPKTEVQSDTTPTEEAATKTTEKSADLTTAVADTPAAPSDKPAEKSEPAAAAAPARPATDPNQVYLYTSLAGAGIHIIPDTNRLQGILKAYKIDFELVDLGTNERAKRIWRYRGQGRKLPAVVRDDEVKGDLAQISEANEIGEVRNVIFDD